MTLVAPCHVLDLLALALVWLISVCGSRFLCVCVSLSHKGCCQCRDATCQVQVTRCCVCSCGAQQASRSDDVIICNNMMKMHHMMTVIVTMMA
jgi:hypothetical protein